MKTIWVVERGEYSNYRVVGVFSTAEMANMLAARINEVPTGYDGDATVSEWPLDPEADQMNQGLRRWFLRMSKDGNAEDVRLDPEGIRYETEFVVVMPQGSSAGFAMAHVWATDEKHAIKIVNEKRIQAIALGHWVSTS